MEIMKIHVQCLGIEKEKIFKVVGDVVKATFWDEDKFLVPLATKKGFIKYCQDKEITSANEMVVSNYIKQQLVRLWNGHMGRSSTIEFPIDIPDADVWHSFMQQIMQAWQ